MGKQFFWAILKNFNTIFILEKPITILISIEVLHISQKEVQMTYEFIFFDTMIIYWFNLMKQIKMFCLSVSIRKKS